MKLSFVLNLWILELCAFALAANMIISCHADRLNNPAPQVPAPTRTINYPNILDTMPRLAETAMEELERIVKEETEQKAKEYATR